ncbi:MAG: DUF3772 domain-containing protein [Pseudomonadota bacterium]
MDIPRFRSLLMALVFVVLAGSVPPAFGDVTKAQHAVARFAEQLEKAEETLKLPDLGPAKLQELRSQLDRLRADALTRASELAPDVKDAESQLAQLGPKPEKGEEDPAVAEKREALSGALAKLQGLAKQLEVAALKAGQISTRAAEIERNQFFEKIFKPSQSALNPALWYQGMATIGRVTSNLYRIIVRWFSDANETSSALPFIICLVLTLGLFGGVATRRIFARLIGPDMEDVAPSSLSRLWRVFRGMFINVVSVLLSFAFVGAVLHALDQLPLQIERVGSSLLTGAVLIAVVHALTHGVLAPARPEWRLARVSDARAVRLRRLLDLGALVIAFGLVLRDIGTVVHLPPGSAAPISAFVALGLAAVLSLCLMVARPRTEEEEAELPFSEIRPGGFGWVATIRIVVWLLVVVVVAACLAGYLAFGRFLMAQVVITGSLIAVLYLAHHLIDELVGTGFRRGWIAGDFLRRTVGLSDSAVDRLGLFLGTFGDFLLFFIGVPVVAFQWAYNLADFKGWATTVFFGFKVGGVTISFATIVAAIIAFVVGLILTRLITSWLDGRVLARTQVDSGIRNSIRTGTGYLGIALAAIFALSYAGVDFSNIAIVAGALGVGIGFGLQSIVNNFVSGLILLAERPIKVGDWISVTGGEGYVTQINVRSTEIKTFDNCSVIVPNSSLISEPVRNWTHEDTRGRVKIPFGVSYDTDPEQVVELVMECVEEVKKEHRILLHPAPAVMFMNFGASSLDFELRIHIPEVDWSLAVASAIRFEILSSFRKAGIEIPFPQTDLNIRDIDRLEKALSPARAPAARTRKAKS